MPRGLLDRLWALGMVYYFTLCFKGLFFGHMAGAVFKWFYHSPTAFAFVPYVIYAI
jgi:hypothetical protein